MNLAPEMCCAIQSSVKMTRKSSLHSLDSRPKSSGLTVPGGGKIGLYQPKHPVASRDSYSSV